MVQVVPIGYDYKGGSRNCLKDGGGGVGGGVQPIMITFLSTIPFGKEGL